MKTGHLIIVGIICAVSLVLVVLTALQKTESGTSERGWFLFLIVLSSASLLVSTGVLGFGIYKKMNP